MPKVAFREEYVKKNDYDYPKLKLKKNEIARIVLLEEPVVEYVHNIRKPKLNGGVPATEQKTRFKDGSTYEDYVYEFVSRPICLGDYATLEAEGTDPKRCPICEEALKSDKFSAPQRRFALHVVKYETLPGKTEVKDPFQATTVIWSFTDRVFTKLYEFQKEWGDLRQRDLILKCENEPFQTYDISVAAKAEWMQGEDRQALVKRIMAPENLSPDITLFTGSKKTETQIGYDIRAVNETWAVINGATASPTDAALSSVGASLSLGEGLDDLLGSVSAPKKDAEGWAVAPEDIASAEAESAPPFEDKAQSSSTADLDELLNNL